MPAIYVDHAATSPIHPQVLQRMQRIEQQFFGNPSSIHRFGREAREQVNQARYKLAQSIGAEEDEIIFTSGGTEANNLAIIGTALARKNEGKHIVTSAIEHQSVLEACRFLEAYGFDITYVPVSDYGVVSVEEIQAALREDTILVSVMYGNNEVGTVQPIARIGELLKEKEISFHTDAVQAYGLLPIDVAELGVQLLSTSAHKINGPKGIGFLYVRHGTKLSPLMFGGMQERKMRAGTENVASIVGFQTAFEINREARSTRYNLYNGFQQAMVNLFSEHGLIFHVNGHEEKRLPHILNISFPNTTADALLVNLDLAGVAASSGSACTSGTVQPSHVLQAMFSDEERIRSALRFSFGLGNTLAEIKKVALETIRAVERMTGG